MKRIFFYLAAFMLIFSACKSETKKENKEITSEKEAVFSIKNAKNTIGFTAYKTTDKVPVKGEFKKVDIKKGGEGNSIKEAINGTEFSIPISSIFTKDESRDNKIRKFFFGIMENTSLLSGKLTLETDTEGTAEILMNGVTNKLPFTYKIENKTFTMKTTMLIDKWNAQEALASLNKACKILHSGADDVSKTWNEVELNITSKF